MIEAAQQTLFNEIKSKISVNQSLVNEVADLLNISIDSAYRRIRGEKALTIDELVILSSQYDISLDQLLRIKSTTLLFNSQSSDNTQSGYLSFLETILFDLKNLNSIENLEVVIAAKDFPIFYNFFIPEIANFKSFFWKKTILQLPEFKNSKFEIESVNEQELDYGLKIAHAFCHFNTSQLWNEEVFTSFINQIQYYYESGFINDKKIALHLYDKTIELINHFQLMAESGANFLPGKSTIKNDSFKLYQNDVIFGDNTIIAFSPNLKRVYFTHNVIDTIYTHNENFCIKTYEAQNNIMNRSVLISKSSERERNRFFKQIRDKVEHRKNILT